MPAPITLRARSLRSAPTDAERRLWRHLRRRQLGGKRFRRQCPVGPYVVDFACPEASSADVSRCPVCPLVSTCGEGRGGEKLQRLTAYARLHKGREAGR
jgi:hypothetical protein